MVVVVVFDEPLGLLLWWWYAPLNSMYVCVFTSKTYSWSLT